MNTPNDPLQPLLLHADEYLLVFNKPSGLLSVPGIGPDKQDCLRVRAQQDWPDALTVHRLDMSTSGLILMARGAAMHKTMSMAFEKRQVHKRYVAVVMGEPRPDPDEEGWSEIRLPMRVDYQNRPYSIIDHDKGKPSLTRWQVTGPGPFPGTMRLLLEPFTGRTHQLRVHLAAIGHPIVGDHLYAPPEGHAMAPRLLLHARELRFTHPVTGEAMELSHPEPF